MTIETSGIPNIQIANIGSKRKQLYAVKGFIELSSWAGYFLFDHTYKFNKHKVASNGRIDLWIEHDIAEDGSFYIPQEQVNSYYYLVECQERIKQKIIETLKMEFPHLLTNEYASWEHDTPNFPRLSDFTTGFDFIHFIAPESINIGDDIKDGQAYVTWRFRCRWDIEHGIEVITFKDSVIDLAPEADIYKIYKDNDTYEGVQKMYKDKVWEMPVKKEMVAILVIEYGQHIY